jgi:hypothetical protein
MVSWLPGISEDDAECFRKSGPPGFLDASTSDDDPLSERINLSQRGVDVCSLSSTERKAVAPTISTVYENVFMNGQENLNTIRLSSKATPGIYFFSTCANTFLTSNI